ncbi:hypothetical protein [Enterobacter bugandensis]|uniref:hypothetical protein n=1 Tax=Enterobacter bugandensis TaxID=881260 RepID=UPI002A82C467|nr:hypothetical protein [Enterobacter bugandensis]
MSEPEHTVNETSAEIQGKHLLVRLNGHSLFNLHRPLDDRYQLTLEPKAGQHMLWMRYPGKDSAKLFSTDDPELARQIMNTTANALQRMAIDENNVKPMGKSAGRWLIPGGLFIFLTGAGVAWLVNAPHQTLPTTAALQSPTLRQPQPVVAPLPGEPINTVTGVKPSTPHVSLSPRRSQRGSPPTGYTP